MKRYISIHMMRQGGLDLNRITHIDAYGFIKVAIIQDFIEREKKQYGD